MLWDSIIIMKINKFLKIDFENGLMQRMTEGINFDDKWLHRIP